MKCSDSAGFMIAMEKELSNLLQMEAPVVFDKEFLMNAVSFV